MTPGFAFDLHFHETVEYEGSDGGDALNVRLCEPGGCSPDNRNRICFRVGNRKYTLRERAGRAKNTPFWIPQVPQTMMDHHGDIFNPALQGFLTGIIQINDLLKPSNQVRVAKASKVSHNMEVASQYPTF